MKVSLAGTNRRLIRQKRVNVGKTDQKKYPNLKNK